MRESEPIPETDAMGREKFWEDLGRPDFEQLAWGIYPIPKNNGLALKLFKEECCDQCSCQQNKEI